MNVGEGSRDGSLLASMHFSPSRLDPSSGSQENGGAEMLLQFWDQLLMGVSHDFQAWVWDVDEEDLLAVISDLECVGCNFLYK